MALSGEVVGGLDVPITHAGQIPVSTARGFGNPSLVPANVAASTSGPASSVQPASIPLNPSSNSTGSSGTARNNESFSTGAIAGIAVGCTVLAVAGITTIGFLLWRRRKNNRNEEAKTHSYFNGPGTDQSLMSADFRPQNVYRMTDVSPLNPDNLDQHLLGQWDGMRPRVAQKQSPTSMYEEDDGGLSHRPELRPEDAAGELHDDLMSHVLSEAGRTALYPASESIWPQLSGTNA